MFCYSKHLGKNFTLYFLLSSETFPYSYFGSDPRSYRINPARIIFVVVLVLSLACAKRAATLSYVHYVEFKVGKPYDFTVKIDIIFNL